jgi:2-oxoglutarate dehydrogenase E2 component (dihydrolipoamide succinyltransferase)
MPINVVVPTLGESISEATIATITHKVGDSVKIDTPLIELETDKVTLEINAPANGVLSSLEVKVGDVVIVGQSVATIDEGKSASTTARENTEKNSPSKDSVPLSKEGNKTSTSQVELAPSVQRIATENNLNLAGASGSGKDGRITKGDALEMSSNQISQKPLIISDDTSLSVRENIVRMSKLRQTIAKRLKDSQNTAAILTTFNEVDMTNIMALRKEYQEIFTKKYNIKLGFMSFFMKACIIALKEIPAVNAEIRGDEIVYKNYADIGVAVGTEAGLVVPVVRGAGKMNIADLEKAVYDFGQKAKEGKISLDDLRGGSFTISNGGTYGSLLSTPIINPPQSGILGMHKIQERPIAINGQIVIRPMMYLALSYDHRIIDGKEAVTFLVRIKELLEDPRRLILDI